MSALRFWDITCDAPIVRDNGREDVCGVSGPSVEWYLKETRRRARREGWTRGPNGEDFCPKHRQGVA